MALEKMFSGSELANTKNTIILFVCPPKMFHKQNDLKKTYNDPKRNSKQCLCKILGWQTKSIMVFLILANFKLVAAIVLNAVPRVPRVSSDWITYFKHARIIPNVIFHTAVQQSHQLLYT